MSHCLDFAIVDVDPAHIRGRFFRYSPESHHAAFQQIQGEDLDVVPPVDPLEVEREFIASALLAFIEEPVRQTESRWDRF